MAISGLRIVAGGSLDKGKVLRYIENIETRGILNHAFCV